MCNQASYFPKRLSEMNQIVKQQGNLMLGAE